MLTFGLQLASEQDIGESGVQSPHIQSINSPDQSPHKGNFFF